MRPREPKRHQPKDAEEEHIETEKEKKKKKKKEKSMEGSWRGGTRTFWVSRVARIPVVDGKPGKTPEYELLWVDSDNEQWSVWFQYSQLVPLDKNLRKNFGSKEVPKFPPSRAFFLSETDADYVEERRGQLEEYLQQVLPRFAGRDPEGLDLLLKNAQLKTDFIVPDKLVHAQVVKVGGEEVWIGLVNDAIFEGLKFFVALKTALEKLVSIEEKLGLLELNAQKCEAHAGVLRNNGETLKRVAETPELPQGTSDYFHLLLRNSRNALRWRDSIENQILMSIEHMAPQQHHQQETPGGMEEVSPLSSPLSSPPPHPSGSGIDEGFYTQQNGSSEDPKVSVASFEERGDELLMRMLACSRDNKAEQAKLLQEKKALLEQMARHRERERNEVLVGRWREAMRFVEDDVVFFPSLHETVLRMECQLYELIDRRANLDPDNVKECTAVRRGLILLRRMLRQVKETSTGDVEDPALRADMNRVTDLQENAAQLQLDLEQNFEFESTMEDMVIDKLKQRVVENATKEHERAEHDMFDL